MRTLLPTIFSVALSLCALTERSYAQNVPPGEKKSVHIVSTNLSAALSKIDSIYAVKIFYPNIDLQSYRRPVVINEAQLSLDQALQLVLKQTNLNYRFNKDGILISTEKKSTQAQAGNFQRKVRGVVKNNHGEALAGVTILTLDKKVIGGTDEKGQFEVTVPAGSQNLTFKNIGYYSVDQPITTNDIFLEITLKTDMHQIEEVVINTGFQKIPKERATGAFDVIDHHQFENKIQTNILERLEGMAPGLLIMNGVDNGGNDAITLRGVSTLAGTKRPLIVVDNFPITGDISSINPRDVESITLLKDAAAASIWGAQSSNGVIVITTKRPKQGKIQYSYNNSFQFSPKPNLSYLNRLSSAEDVAINQLALEPYLDSYASYANYYLSGVEKLYVDQLRGLINEDQYQQELNTLSSLDNAQQIKDLLMQNPLTLDQTFVLSGGGEHARFYSSIRNINQRGYALRDDQKTTTLFLKSMFDLSPKLSLNINANLNFTNGSNPPVDPAEVYRYKPYEMLADENGNPLAVNTTGDPNRQVTSNEYSIAQRIAWGLGNEGYYPLNELYLTDDLTRSANQRVQAELTYKIIDGLQASLYYQYETGYNLNSIYNDPAQYELAKMINTYTIPMRDANDVIITNADGTLQNPTFLIPQGGRLTEQRGDARSYNIRPMISFNKTFNKSHDVSLLLGGERSATITSYTNTIRYGYDPNSLLYTLIDANTLATTGSRDGLENIVSTYDETDDNNMSYVENRYIAAFFNGAYTYQQKYTLSGSARMDQTNLFGSAESARYRPNWSLGLSWLISNEEFMKNSLFDQLKIRATYGVNGNINRDSGPFMIATASQNPFTQLPSYSITSPANPALGWEATYVTNIGVDYSLLKGRLSGKVDFYDRDSRNVLANESINPTLGFSTATLNVGGVNNRGVEIELSSQNIMHPNFKWRTSLNYSYNRNIITYLEPTQTQQEAYYRAGTGNIQGYPYQSLWSFQFAGLSPETGQLRVYDANGVIDDGNAMITDINALTFSGATRPQSSGAISNFFSYKNFDLSVMFVWYGDFYNRRSVPLGGTGVDAYSGDLAGAWTQPGDENSTIIPYAVPSYNDPDYYVNAYYQSYLDAYVFNASYIKLREVVLTYNVGQNLLDRTHFFRRAQVNFQARNLWTYTVNDLGIDPEAFANGVRTMPVSPTFAIGLNLEF